MRNILIIGCGLLGSSLVRRISKKKIAKKIFIYEKSKSNIAKIKSLRLPGTIVKSLKDGLVNSNLVIVCTSTSEYKKLILKINKTISPKTLITDVGSSKIESSKIIRSELITAASNELTMVPGNFNFLILEIFDFDFS